MSSSVMLCLRQARYGSAHAAKLSRRQKWRKVASGSLGILLLFVAPDRHGGHGRRAPDVAPSGRLGQPGDRLADEDRAMADGAYPSAPSLAHLLGERQRIH